MQKITLSHPEISFKMIRDNRIEFNSAGDGELYSAVYAIYGKDFVKDLMSVDYEYNGVHVSGYIVKPLYSKGNRTFQNFFVNGRYVRSKLCSSAVENAYKNMVMTGKFPACVLMIDMSSHDIDVNAIYFAVKNALMSNGLIYEFEMKQEQDWRKTEETGEILQQKIQYRPLENTGANKQLEEVICKTEQEFSEMYADKKPAEDFPGKLHENPFESTGESAEKLHENSPESTEESTGELHKNSLESTEESAGELHENPPESTEKTVESYKYITPENFEKHPEKTDVPRGTQEPSEEKPDIKIIGEAFGLYILAEYDKKIIMIDKHAAHERIIFERLKKGNGKQYGQALITGIKVLLTAEEIDVMENNKEILENLGFIFDFSEKPCIIATAVPTFIMDSDIESIICEIAGNLRMYKQNPQSELLDDILHNMACKAAIKANDKCSPEEMKSLVEQILADENIRHCPHGRPVMFTMTKSNIDHQFRRT